MTHVSRNM